MDDRLNTSIQIYVRASVNQTDSKVYVN